MFNPRHFPDLNNHNHRVTSDPRDGQNCIAYAAGDDIHYWWPVSADDFPGPIPPPYFWPKDAPRLATIDAFMKAFATVRFCKCDDNEDGRLEAEIEKIAVFTKRVEDANGTVRHVPTHAAVQSPLRNGKWRSKMGIDEDIDHDLASLHGPLYGTATFFMRRTFADRKIAAKNPPKCH